VNILLQDKSACLIELLKISVVTWDAEDALNKNLISNVNCTYVVSAIIFFMLLKLTPLSPVITERID
jgi:hypothetical protein